MIEVKGLVKKYGSHTAVDHLNFRIEKGHIYGLLGPNGDNMLGRDFLCKIRKNVSTP